MRLLHISDLHVQLPDWRTRALSSLGPLRKLATVELFKGRGPRFDEAEDKLKRLVARSAAFDHVACTGDLVQLCLREEYERARAAFGPLAGDAGRLTCLPGNHDRYPEGLGPSPLYEEFFPEQARSDLPAGLVRTRLVGEAALVVFDSAPNPSWPVLTPGFARAPAVERLARTLAHPEVQRRCALVLVHHAPLRHHGGAGLIPKLYGHPRFLRACRDGGAQAILCGHVHRRADLAATNDHPRMLCVGSTLERGREGAFELTIEDARLSAVREVGPAELFGA